MDFLRRLVHSVTPRKDIQQSPKLVIDKAGIYQTKSSKLDRLVDSTVEEIERVTKAVRKKCGRNVRPKKYHFSGVTERPCGVLIQQDQLVLASASVPLTNEPIPLTSTDAPKIVDGQSVSPPTEEVSTGDCSGSRSSGSGPNIKGNGGADIRIFEPEASEHEIYQPEAIISETIKSGVAAIQICKTKVVGRRTIDTNLSMPRNANISSAVTIHPVVNESPIIESIIVEAPTDVEPLKADHTEIEHPAIVLAHRQIARDAVPIHGKKDSKIPSDTASPGAKGIKDPIWGPINQIPNQHLETLAMIYAPPGDTKAVVVGCKSGLHNRVIIVEYQPKALNIKRCIRVPASGWEDRWSDLDKFQLRRSVDTMAFLKKNTSMPVPEVFHWDVELDNAIQAPYTMMSFMEGQAPSSIWQGDVYTRSILPLYDDTGTV